ncbi:MAG: hypothetical protein MR936_11615 [Eubacterium sp.]|nr:hypothetical protein [Eubacterium sp.]
MKKIYSKITKERNVKFQIETAIYEDTDGKKIVEKKPLNSYSEAHIRNMYKNHQCFLMDKIDEFLPCEMRGQSLVFPYVEGSSLYNQFLDAAEAKDRDAVLDVFREYEKIIHTIYPCTHAFQMSEQFREIFGEFKCQSEMMASEKVDIDLTFDNIVFTKAGVRILDYEWIFDFDIPIKFPVYRAIYALFARHADILDGVVSDEELYQMASISKEERKAFQDMNNRFMEYVEGKEEAYAQILLPYLKPEDGVVMEDHAFVYWGENGRYSENRMVHHPVPLQQKIKLCIELEGFSNTDCIRIDPTEGASMIKVLRFEAETDHEVVNLMENEYESNMLNRYDNYLIFTCKDPQIIIPVQKNRHWKRIIFEYRIEYIHLEHMTLFFDVMQSFCQREVKKWQDKAKEKQEVSDEQSRLLNECAHKISDCEEIIQLQKDKLAYIESTKAYQTLLKNKVDAMHLWDRLN